MRQTISISSDFFCDGHCYLLTSSSLGGSGWTAEEMQDIIFEENAEKTTKLLLEKGVCLPFCFPGDCALDGETEFVVGDLTEREEQDWKARLVWKLNVPCGKLILCCGCMAEDLEPAMADEKPDSHYRIYQVIDVPPNEYKIEIYAYAESQTVRVALDDDEEYDDEDDLEDEENDGEAAYIIRLTPLDGETLPLPALEYGWFHQFEFRAAQN